MLKTFFTNSILLISILFGQTFSDFISEVEGIESEYRQSKVDSFIATIKSFPITEDTLVHFIFQGINANPFIVGDFTKWDHTIAPMVNLPETDLWYLSKQFKKDARLDYQIVYKDTIWIFDPLNPFTVKGGFGSNSELRMPDYNPPVEVTYITENLHGALIDTLWYSSNLKNSRRIQIYLPPNYYNSSEVYPVILVNDGAEYLSSANMNNILDNLISSGTIKPLIAVFVPPVERDEEYLSTKKDQYERLIINELVPWIDREFRTNQNPNKRLIMGSSLGGNISLWIAIHNSNIFGKVGVFSPYFEKDMLKSFSMSEKMNLKIYMLHGIYDHIDEIHTSVKKMLTILKMKNYNYKYNEYPEGHSYGLWRAHIDDLLVSFFP